MASETTGKVERGTRLRPEDRRRHLVEAGLATFARKGYGATELADVAESAGVGRPLLYHYFEGGKEDLYVAVLDHAWGELVGRLEIDPERGRGLLPVNLAAFLDLVEAGDPAVEVIMGSRRLESERIRAATRSAAVPLARAMAANQLGLEHPSQTVLTSLLASLMYFGALLEEWRSGGISRAQLERLIVATIPAIADAAVTADDGGR